MKSNTNWEKSFDFMAAGHLCLDIIPRFKGDKYTDISDIIVPGKLVNMDGITVSTGGPVSNTGQNLKKLGGSVCYCACIGDDVIGDITVQVLNRSGNASGIRALKNVSSSYTVVIAPPGIDRTFLHNPGANNAFSADDLDVEIIKKCRHFHFGYPPLMEKMYCDEGEELKKVFTKAKEAGAITSCDMSLPDHVSESGNVNWRKILEKILPFVDIFVPSIEETFYMLYPDKFIEMKNKHNNEELIDYIEPKEYTAISEELLSMGTKITTLKSGYRGFYIRTAQKNIIEQLGEDVCIDIDNWSGREVWAPAFVVDDFGSATGSGDSSIAGLLIAFNRGQDIESAVKYATCCGWQNCMVMDALSGMHSIEETTAFIEKKMPMLDVHISDNKWKWINNYNVYISENDKKW